MKTPTTWKYHGIVHEVLDVQGRGRPIKGLALMSFRTTCGIFQRVDDERAFDADRSVGCLECLNGPITPSHWARRIS